MTWIDDAQNKAKEIKLASVESIRISELKKDDWENPSSERYEALVKLLKTSGIETVLNNIRSQGLIVSIDREGFFTELGDLFYYLVPGTSGDGFAALPTKLSYGISLNISEPSTNLHTNITLGFTAIHPKKIVRDKILFWEKHEAIDYKTTLGYKPTITPQEIEEKVKDWLVEIFSK